MGIVAELNRGAKRDFMIFRCYLLTGCPELSLRLQPNAIYHHSPRAPAFLAQS
jgi:hypothetical protein